MEHEILFRGKPMFREIDEFVYGYYKQGDIAGVKTDFILPLPEYKNEINEVAVCPMTVGQYTGLTDKNGVKIFEGDIVRSTETSVIGIVQWFSEHSAFMIWCKSFNKIGFLYECAYVVEVIGNIHDNPELLKGEPNV